MIRSMKVCAALLVVSLAATAMAGAADKRPNILFIIADDQSPFDFKTYNPASGLETPVLDKLAEGGWFSMAPTTWAPSPGRSVRPPGA